MSGNATNDTKALAQSAELVGCMAKAMALVAPKMTTQARQSWIGMSAGEIATVLEKLVFLPANHNPENLVIDCDVTPFVPDGWTVKDHQKSGLWQWNPAAVTLYLANGQQGDRRIEGNKLRQELASQPVLNANVLDFLLANPHLIPEEWKKKAIFFWGTVYCSAGGFLYVRFLFWRGGRWGWFAVWLDCDWYSHYPALVRASPEI